MYFLVNASLPEPLDIATSNFAGAYEGTGRHFCNIDPKVNVKGKKRVFAMVYHSKVV